MIAVDSVYRVTYSPERVAARRARLLGADSVPGLREAAGLVPRPVSEFPPFDYYAAARRRAASGRRGD